VTGDIGAVACDAAPSTSNSGQPGADIHLGGVCAGDAPAAIQRAPGVYNAVLQQGAPVVWHGTCRSPADRWRSHHADPGCAESLTVMRLTKRAWPRAWLGLRPVLNLRNTDAGAGCGVHLRERKFNPYGRETREEG